MNVPMCKKTSHKLVVPLLFIRPSRDRPLRVNNPIRYNRRSLSQPYRPHDLDRSVRCSEAMFHALRPIPLSLSTASTDQTAAAVPRMFSVKHLQRVLFLVTACLISTFLEDRLTQNAGFCQSTNIPFTCELSTGYILPFCHRSPTDNSHP